MKCYCSLKFIKINVVTFARNILVRICAPVSGRVHVFAKQAPAVGSYHHPKSIRAIVGIKLVAHQVAHFKCFAHLFTTIVSGALRGFLLALGALPLGVGVALRKQRPQAMWPL